MNKVAKMILLLLVAISAQIDARELDLEQFAKQYFQAWVATQVPNANAQDIENYLKLLKDDIGHQHLPYDPVADRQPDGKQNMREGMAYYLGAHTSYASQLLETVVGHNMVVIKYHTASSGIHPQSKQEITQAYETVEVLEMEDGKVAVIRKYSE